MRLVFSEKALTFFQIHLQHLAFGCVLSLCGDNKLLTLREIQDSANRGESYEKVNIDSIECLCTGHTSL